MEPMLPSFPLEETPWICSFLSHVQSCHQLASQAVVAEWLRRLTRNQFPSGSVGSNPTDCELFFPQPCACTHSVPLSCSSCLDGPGVQQHRWFSGRMLACHAGGPGSIPGRCKFLLLSQKRLQPKCWHNFCSVVECLPATQAARVQVPDDASLFCPARKTGADILWAKVLEAPGIDPGTSRMLSERSTI